MTPTTYKICIRQDRNYECCVSFGSKNFEQLSFWKTNNSASSNIK